MSTLAIKFTALHRRGADRIVLVDEVAGDETIHHTLVFDELTFAGVERVFATHPFARKKKENDAVYFQSLDTPIGDTRKYFGLLIVNGRSRQHIKIEVSPDAFAAMKVVFDGWCVRTDMNKRPNQAPLPTPVSVTPAAGAPVAPDTGAAEL